MESLTTKAYNDFMTRLFGHVPKEPGKLEVPRERYTEIMHEVQKEYGLTQGHPDFLEFMLTMVGRSPKIIEGAGEDGTDATNTDTSTKAVGETSHGATERTE